MNLQEQMLHAAKALASDQGKALEAGASVLLAAGASLSDLEVVHETFSRTEEPYVIHTRAYVRIRKETTR